MALTVGELNAVLRLKDDGFDASLQKHKAEFTGFASSAKAALSGISKDDGIDSAMQKHKASFSSFATGATAALAGIGFASFANQAKENASELTETLGKSQIIFGQNADGMEQWASTAADTMGLSKQAALEAGASFGDMFSQIGFGSDQAAQLSREVVQMSADFGAFNNLPTDDVIERISASFRGEYDSLQKIIPNISAARIEHVALAQSSAKNAAALTAEQKAQAVMTILRTDGARAMGNYAQTADQLAQQEKTAAAKSQDFSAQLGQDLIPIMSKATALTSAFLGVFNDLPGPIQTGIIVIGGFAAATAILGPRISTLASYTGAAASKVATLGVAFKANAAGASVAAGALDGLKVATGAASAEAAAATGRFSGMKGVMSGAAGALAGPWGLAITTGVGLLAAFAMNSNQASQAQQDFKQAILDASGAMDDNVTKMAAKAAQDAGLLTFAQQQGIALNDVTAALIGNSDAQQRVNDAMQKSLQLAQQQAQYNAAGQLAGPATAAQNAQADATQKAIDAFHNLITTQTGAVAEAQQLSQATAGLTSSTTGASGAAQQLTQTTNQAKVAQMGFAASLDAVNAKLSRQSAHDDAVKAAKALTASVKDNGAAFKGNSDEALANRAALMQLVQAKLALAKAKASNPQDAKEVEDEFRKMRKGIIDNIDDIPGISRKKAKEIVQQYVLAAKAGPQQIGEQKGDWQQTGNDLGGSLDAGTVGGIQKGMPDVNAAARQMAAQAKEAAKAELDSHSPSREMMKEGHNFDDGFALGVTQRGGNVVGAVTSLFKGVKAAAEGAAGAALRGTVASSATEAAKIAIAIQKQNVNDQKMIDKLNKQGLSKKQIKAGKSTGKGDLWKAAIDAQRAFYDKQREDALSAQQAAQQAAQEAAQQAADAARQAAEAAAQQRAQQVQQFAQGVSGDLTSMKTIGSARAYIANQRKQLQAYRNNLINLAKRGLPQEMLAQIASSPSAMAWAAALANSSDSDFSSIVQDAMALSAEANSFANIAADVQAGQSIAGAPLQSSVIDPQYKIGAQALQINVVVQDGQVKGLVKAEIDQNNSAIAGQLVYR